MPKFATPKGTFDILPAYLCFENWHSSEAWHEVESTFIQEAQKAGFHRIQTPIFEQTELFYKSTGETTDIVGKEMYSFEDKSGRSMTLRPEGTPGTLRALVNCSAHQTANINKVFYSGPMFRYERPQKGRYRQFHQFGIELIGPKCPYMDIEVISIAWAAYQRLSLDRGVRLEVNSIGSTKERLNYRHALVEYFKSNQKALSADSLRRLETNPLRILDSKEEQDVELIASAPIIWNYLNTQSIDHFETLCTGLEACAIPYHKNPRMVRGLDYYNDTVFEWVSDDLGAKSSIGGGGRYDKLYHQLGGPDLQGVGFACGLERVIMSYLQQKNECQTDRKNAIIIAIGSHCHKRAMALAHALRAFGQKIEYYPIDHPKKIKNAMSWADTMGYRYALIFGEEELDNLQIQCKDLSSRTQFSCKLEPSIIYENIVEKSSNK